MHPAIEDAAQRLYSNRATLPHYPVSGLAWHEDKRPVLARPVVWQTETGDLLVDPGIDGRIEDGALKGFRLVAQDDALDAMGQLEELPELQGNSSARDTLRVVH